MSHIEIAQRSARGTLLLFVGNVLSTAVLAGATVVIARLLGPDSYGQYTLALFVPSLFLYFVGLGVNLAVTRYSAYYLSRGESEKARSITKTAIWFLALTGVLLTALVYLVGGPISALVLKRPGLEPYVQVAALYLLGATVLHSCIAAFIGWHANGLASFSSVLQAVLKLLVSAWLIIAGVGVMGAVVGQVGSYLVAGVASLAILYVTRLRGVSTGPTGILVEIREMMGFGAPPFMGALVSGLASQFVIALLAMVATNTVVGYYQAAVNVTAAISLTSTAISNALFAAFSSLEGIKGDTALAFKLAVKYVSFGTVPIVVFLMASAGPLVQVLFGNYYVSSVPFLQLLALSNIPLAIGFNVTPNFFMGIGKSKLTLVFYLSGALSLSALAPILAMGIGLGVEGLIYAQFAANSIAAILGLYFASSRLRARIDGRSGISILVASGIALIVTQLVPTTIWPAAILVGDMIVFPAVYLTAVPLLRGLSQDDFIRLSIASEGFGTLRRIAVPILRFERYILRKTARVNQEPRTESS